MFESELDELEKRKKEKPQPSTIYKVGSIHPVACWGEKTETDTIYAGTPMKIISVDDETRTIRCEDYKGREHQFKPVSLEKNEIKKYPSHFKIMFKKIFNLWKLEDEDPISIDIKGSNVLNIIFFIAGVLFFVGLASKNLLLIFIPVIFAILLFSLCLLYLISDDPLYKPQNLKELKILLTRKEAEDKLREVENCE